MANHPAEKQQDNSKKIPGRPFEKGKSGNPNGRPKLEVSANNLIRQFAQKLEKNRYDLGEVTIEENFIQDLFQLARSGNSAAINQLCDRMWGKVTQPVDLPEESNIEKIAHLMLIPSGLPKTEEKKKK